MSKINFKKIIRFICILMILCVMSVLPYQRPQKAEAIPVVEIGANVATNLFNTVETILQFAEDLFQSGLIYDDWIKEFISDPLAWGVAKWLIGSLQDQVLDWIKSGFPDGDPAFIQDLDAFFNGAITNAQNIFWNQLTTADICPKFKPAIVTSMNNQISPPTLVNKIQCPDNDILSKFTAEGATNMDDCLLDFDACGGWAGYLALYESPANPSKAYLISEYELMAAEQKAKEQAEIEAQMNNGFRSLKECVSFDGAGNCLKYIVKTPATTIEGYLQETITSQIRQMETADELSEILMGMVINGILTKLQDGI